jgi:hypothetical protein
MILWSFFSFVAIYMVTDHGWRLDSHPAGGGGDHSDRQTRVRTTRSVARFAGGETMGRRRSLSREGNGAMRSRAARNGGRVLSTHLRRVESQV